MKGIMQFADERWLDFHLSRLVRESVVYYCSLNKKIKLGNGTPLFCVLKGTPPRKIVAVGYVKDQKAMSSAEAWKEYGSSLGAATEEEWLEQASVVLENSKNKKKFGGKF